MTLRVLSIRNPWAWAILHAGKDVENRSWPTEYRGMIAVHASRLVEADAVRRLRAMGYEVPDGLPTGAVLGVVDIINCVRGADSPWAAPEHWHWRLANPRPLPRPIPCKGALRLFHAPVDVAAQVRSQLDRGLTAG